MNREKKRKVVEGHAVLCEKRKENLAQNGSQILDFG